MQRIIKFNSEAREKLVRGVNVLANAVKVTMGPRGRNVIIDKGFGSPIITKDGVTVARSIFLDDEVENLGAELAKEAAVKTNEEAGDATTATIVMLQGIINEGHKLIAAGYDPLQLKREMEEAAKTVIDSLDKNSKKITTDKEIEDVASISANDKELGKIIAEVVKSAGPEGVVQIEEGSSFELEKDIVDGTQFEKGYASPYMVNKKDGKSIMENVHILITDKKITTPTEIDPIINKMLAAGLNELVIIADDFEGQTIPGIISARVSGIFNILAIKAPGFAERKKDYLQDLCFLTGATFVTDETNVKLADIEIKDLGKAVKVISTKDNTTIYQGAGDKESIGNRILEIKDEKEKTKSAFEKEKLQERIAKLTGKVTVLRVGGVTETEMKEKKDRVEDAVNATRSAIESGISVGGGYSFKDIKSGNNIIDKIISLPRKQIIDNAGYNGDVVMVNKKGFNAATGEYCDMMESGIIDPTKSIKCALKNAISTATMILTAEVVVADKKNEGRSQVSLRD
jgi:chaperonin GroEL